MKITVNATKASIQNGMGLFDLYLGAETYGAVRTGEKVEITCTDGETEGTIQSVQIGPLGQFLQGPATFVDLAGRVSDLRSLVDALETRYPPTKTNKSLDPRTLYTAVFVSVPYAQPTGTVTLVPAPAPAV